MKTKQIIAVILFTLLIIVKLFIDIHLYNAGGVNSHVLGPLLIAIGLCICSILGGLYSIPMWFLCYWAVFDSMYGLFIGQSLLYIGTTARLDILQHTYPVLQWLKYILAVISVWFFIKNRLRSKSIF